ncbi:MAG TPA: Na+/H+ antiporter NhaA [Rhizomicrobium sp.]|nr:Na+/H+ antiporter NhaA [Rhizomicrobium sp.]
MSAVKSLSNRLDRPVRSTRDHVLGPEFAPITLVEYGSYDCPHCRAANERITEVREQFGDRLRYVFRHRPVTGSALARRAAELVELADNPDSFWDAHVELMTRSSTLTEDDLRAVAVRLKVTPEDDAAKAQAKARVDADVASARASGVQFTPTFFVNSRRYDGPWDTASFSDAILGSLGHRVRTTALEFASWAPSTGLLLLAASLLAIALTNSPLGADFAAFWHMPLGISLGAQALAMSLLHWVNDALLTIFFFVVGLEIKREFTVGSLSGWRQAALPIAAAIGGMVVPALLYLAVVGQGAWAIGWGVPMATDTAFAVAIIAMMGARVPVELRVFLTAAAIVDDIGSILVVAVFYSGALQPLWLLGAGAVVAMLWLLNRSSIYRITPYVVLGVVLWLCVQASGLHATLAGVLLAAFIPTRPPPDYKTLAAQAESILTEEARHRGEQYRRGPSEPALKALDAIFDRLESPADRVLRTVAPRSSYIVLPIFALANAGVALGAGMIGGHGMLMLAIMAGLVVGKPLGYFLACWAAVKAGIAEKPASYSWRQLGGAGALAGIGFTMSLFIAGQSFPLLVDFDAAKIAVFGASIVSSLLGVAILWNAKAPAPEGCDATD